MLDIEVEKQGFGSHLEKPAELLVHHVDEERISSRADQRRNHQRQIDVLIRWHRGVEQAGPGGLVKKT